MNETPQASLSIGQIVSMACLLEVSAPKVGNVNRSADFAETTFYDFAVSAVAIGAIFERADQLSLGDLVFESIQATRQVTNCNTNLGIVLLLAPLAIAAANSKGGSLGENVTQTLGNLTQHDCEQVYRAIQLAKPGGMGNVEQHDVAQSPETDLLSAMQMAKDRDLIALQYCNNFRDVFDSVLPNLETSIAAEKTIPDAIVLTQIRLMSCFEDSLIARKCGSEVASLAKNKAKAVASLEPGSGDYLGSLADFDFWLRSDSNRRNPGTTADLITAGLFVGLWENTISQPIRFAGN